MLRNKAYRRDRNKIYRDGFLIVIGVKGAGLGVLLKYARHGSIERRKEVKMATMSVLFITLQDILERHYFVKFLFAESEAPGLPGRMLGAEVTCSE